MCLDVAHDTGCWVVSGAGVDLGKFLKQGTMMERVCLWRPAIDMPPTPSLDVSWPVLNSRRR